MISFTARIHRTLTFAATGVLVALLSFSSAHAQNQISSQAYADGVEVMDTITANQTDIIAVVTVDNVDDYDIEYVAAVAQLFDGSSLVAEGSEDDEYDSAVSTAETSVVTGQQYNFDGYVGACYYYGEGDDDDDDDDDGGAEVRTGAAAPAISPGEGSGDCDFSSLGYLPLPLQTGVPSLTSISPNSGTVGASGTITVEGTNLEDAFGDSSVSISGGVNASVQSPGADSATISYSIPSTVTSGSHTLTMSNTFGVSNGLTFTVGDPPAVVTSLDPPAWAAGTTFPLTINGSGFGTAPTLSISALGVTFTQPPTVQPNGMSMQTTVTVAASAPNEVATVTVQPGYTGSSFTCGSCNGGSGVGTNTAPISALSAAMPLILDGVYSTNQCQGTSIANSTDGDNTQNVVVGQLIQFTACIPPNQASVASSTWAIINSQFSQSATSGFSTTSITAATPGPYQSAPNAPNCNINALYCDFAPKFYFLTQGTYNFTFSYTLTNGNSASATVTYQVAGPTPDGDSSTITTGEGPFTNACAGTYLMCASSVTTEFIDTQTTDPVGALRYSGITFFNKAVAPPQTAGAFQWVQVLAPRTDRIIDATTNGPCTAAPGGLDNVYPFSAAGDATSDGPPEGFFTSDMPAAFLTVNPCTGAIDTGLGEINDSFHATMYLLWDPSLDSSGNAANGCAAHNQYTATGAAGTPTPSTCSGSIPAPLASIYWGFCGGAINTLTTQSSTNTNWILSCNMPSVNDPSTPIYADAESLTNAPKWTAVQSDNP